MTKNTMGTKLPRKLEQKMQIVGEQIKLARLRRNLSVGSGGRTGYLFTAYCVPNRKRDSYCCNRDLSTCFVCICNLTMIFYCLPKKIKWEKLCKI